jgi:rhodanese-related sulfurtransferase
MKIRSMSLVLVAGLATWVAASADSALAPLSQEAFLERVKAGAEPPYVLDVRTPEEFVSGHVPGAVNIAHDQLATRLADVPKDRDVVIYCRSGRRAELAGEVLAGSGYTRLEHLEGDIVAWVDQGLPMERPRDADACVAALKSGGPTEQACAAN